MKSEESKILKRCLLFFILMTAIYSLQAQDKQYYVNSVAGVDTNPGTIGAPWKTLAKVKSTNFQPGDIINFAKGSSWTGGSNDAADPTLLVDNSGTALKPITFRSYDGGNVSSAKPTFSNTTKPWGICITVNADYVIVDDLLVTNTPTCGFFFTTSADHNIARNCEVTKTGIAFQAYGPNNLFTRNYTHDLTMIVDDTGPYCSLPRSDPRWSRVPCDDDYGATSFWFYAPNNEVSYNRVINNVGHSYDYKGFDGGFLELYNDCDNTYAHHNWVENGVGLMESSNNNRNQIFVKKNIRLAYNVFINNKDLFATPRLGAPVENLRIENNTFITKTGTVYNNMLAWDGSNTELTPQKVFVRNNIFVLQGDASGERVTGNNKFTHTNNLYYLTNGATLGSLVLGPGERIVNNLFFVNEAANDFRLTTDSPAKDAGANLGYSIDYAGNPVPSGGMPDIGAYEFQAPVLIPEINIKQSTTSIADGTGSYSFGNVTFGTSKTVTFTIENTGTGTLNLTGTPRVVVTAPGFSRTVDAPVSVGASGTATFQVKLQPNAAGLFNGTISIANNDANENPYNFSISGTGTKADQTISFSALPAKTVGDADFNPGSTSDVGLAVAYSSSNTAVATIVGGLIHIVGAGTSVITALQAGNANYNAATNVTQTLTILSPLRTPENPPNLVSGLTYNYYEGVWSLLPDFNSLTPAKIGFVSTTDLTPRLRDDDFAFRYSGYIHVPADGSYTFYTNSDDGSALYIGNTLVVNNDGLHGSVEASGTIGLKQGKHAITINFFEHLFDNTLTVSYEGPGIGKVLIPSSAYYSTSPTVTLEAEDAFLFGAVVASGLPGTTGTGFADYINLSGDYIEWTANTQGAGTYILTFRYALFSGTRNLQINVNGSTINSNLAFPSTGSWSTWQILSVTTTLNAGINKIRATTTGTEGPIVDNLVVEKSGIARIDIAESIETNQDKISAYPNPAVDELNVTFNAEGETDASIELLSTMSQVVSKRSHRTVKGSNTVTLDIRGLNAGMYLLNVKSGSHKTLKKIIIGN